MTGQQKGVGVFFSDESYGDLWLKHAYEQIKREYGATVQVKQSSLLKFGKNEDIDAGTAETVWMPGSHEVHAAANSIDTLSSSSAADLQDLVVEGLTLSGSDFTYVTQPATLNGQNKILLTTPLARCVRIYNDDATDLDGTVYAYEDDTLTAGVPDTASKIHAQLDGADNQTLQCATTVPHDQYWLITQVYGGINNKTAASVVFNVQIRLFGKTFRTQPALSAHPEGGASPIDLRPFIIVPANADFRMTALSDTANVSVTTWANGILCEVQ